MERLANSKYRHELKYICTDADMQLIESKLKVICKPDSHVGEGGQYRISSVYFDDYQDTYFYENENGTDPREKYRIRIYNDDMSRITLECKRKCRGMTQKEACLLTREEYEYLMRGGDMASIMGSEKPLLIRFAVLQQERLLRPKVIVEYDRVPYVYGVGNVRITFDRNISSCISFDEFGKRDKLRRPILPMGQHILEVKYDEFLPDYIYNVVQHQNLIRTNFSKYYLCRRYKV